MVFKVCLIVFFINMLVDVVVMIFVIFKNLILFIVIFWEVDKVGNNVVNLGVMVDMGDMVVFNCDEIQDDGVFFRCAQL